MCSICYAEIPDNASLCDGCENDMRQAQDQEAEDHRLFQERQARAMCVE